MKEIIKIKNLKKSYNNLVAVDGIDFTVREGELFAFLGVNGAGKSTTINMICTFLKPDEGEIIINGMKIGRDDDNIRKLIGVVFQENLLDRKLTVYENLYTRGQLYGYDKKTLLKNIGDVIEIFELDKIKNKLYGELSGGQKRRSDIARALLHKPKILFLDEPTTGLDPQSRKLIWEIILKMKKENNMTIFLTTHYMEEVLEANYITIIDEGNIKVSGTPSEIREKYSPNKLIMEVNDIDDLSKELNRYSYKIVSNNLVIDLEKTVNSIELLNLYYDKIISFEVIKGTMDDAFINITGKEII